jgi:hypothetical protein
MKDKFPPRVRPRFSVSISDFGGRRIESLPVKVPSLTELLLELSPLPNGSVLLGALDDRLPVLIDLVGPESSSVLLIGDPGSGKSKLLHTIINSACAINPPRKLRVCCFSDDAQHVSLSVYPHTYRFAGSKAETSDLLSELVETAGRRLYGGYYSSSIVVVIDDLAELCRGLEPEQLNQLLWLVQNGPEVQVVVFAGYNPRKSQHVSPSILNAFPTWLLGHSDPLQAGSYISHEVLQASQPLLPGAQFAAYSDGEWVPFWIPAS